MKQIVLLLAFVVIAMASNAQKVNRSALKINPLSLAAKTGNVSFEQAIGARSSIQLGAFYSGVRLGDLQYQGYGITPEVRFYLGSEQQPLNGLYVAPFGRFQNFEISSKELNNKARFSTVGGGAVFGWQKTWKDGFLLNFFAGPSYNKLNFRNNNQEDDFDIKGGIKGFGLRSGIALGFSF